jgi:hypothetical protein
MRLQLDVVVIVLLLACHTAAGRSQTRDLLQESKRRTRRAAPEPVSVSSTRNKNGVFFDFTPFGGAAAFLARQEPAVLAKLMASYGRERGINSLANELDADADFVSVVAAICPRF